MAKSNYLGLPENVKFCKSCVISNQRPSSVIEFKNTENEQKPTIEFNEDGLCSACEYQNLKANEIDWEKREKELKILCDKYRGNGTEYDCIIPGSGGKDSAFTSHILKYKYGLNPLTVTWAPHKYTEIGWKNFESWTHKGGFDNVLFTPNGKLHAHLTRLAFLNLFHPFQPFIVGQKLIGPKLAKKFGIKLIFYGENQAEYGNKIKDNFNKKFDKKFYSINSFEDIILGGEKISNIVKNSNFKISEFLPYLPFIEGENKTDDLDYQYLGYYLKWDPQECYYYASEHTGFEANTERTQGSYSKYSSIDDKIDYFHYYTTYIKFGLGRASYDAAQEIRNGKITRDEGVGLVKKFDSEFPTNFFKDFLDYINLSESDFFDTVEKFRSTHLWKKTKDQWELRNKIWDQTN
jgi:N-acetyl sugar amidotransferase